MSTLLLIIVIVVFGTVACWRVSVRSAQRKALAAAEGGPSGQGEHED
jgi:hypothetical protein